MNTVYSAISIYLHWAYLIPLDRSSNALTGVGVNEGIEWLCANISNAKRK